jgi:uncharacterized membrane protein YgcG
LKRVNLRATIVVLYDVVPKTSRTWYCYDVGSLQWVDFECMADNSHRPNVHSLNLGRGGYDDRRGGYDSYGGGGRGGGGGGSGGGGSSGTCIKKSLLKFSIHLGYALFILSLILLCACM